MADVGYATLQVIPSMRGMGTALNRGMVGPAALAGRQAGGKFRGGMLSSVKGMAGPLLAGAGVFALAKGIGSVVSTASDFEKRMSAVGAVSAARSPGRWTRRAATRCAPSSGRRPAVSPRSVDASGVSASASAPL